MSIDFTDYSARVAFVWDGACLKSAIVREGDNQVKAGQRMRLTRDVTLAPMGTLRAGTTLHVARVDSDGTMVLVEEGCGCADTWPLMPFECDAALVAALRRASAWRRPSAATVYRIAATAAAFLLGWLALPQPESAAAIVRILWLPLP